MVRQMFVAAAIAALLAPVAHAAAGDRVCTPEGGARIQLATSDLAPLFERVREVFQTREKGVFATMSAGEVVVARIDADGNLVLGCVDDAEAAERFFEAPVRAVNGPRAQEK